MDAVDERALSVALNDVENVVVSVVGEPSMQKTNRSQQSQVKDESSQ